MAGCTSNDTTGSKAQLRDTAKLDTVKKVVHISPIGIVTDHEFSQIVTDTLDVACGEQYTYDTCKLTDEKYIFIADASDQAMIKINGKNIALKKEENESEQLGEESFRDVYKGGAYTVILTVKQTGNYDTGSYYTGTLQISGNNVKETLKVRGKAGC